MSYGRERIVLVELDQPLCTRLYGDGLGSPTPASGCQAALSATEPRKCYNTRATCQDPANYNAGTLTLTFARPQQDLTRHYGSVLPSVTGISTTPGAINLAAMDKAMSALGQREVVTITLDDHRHSDLLVDKYRLERYTGAASFGSPSETFDPYTRGTFWGKWLARNPYHQGYALRVRDGFLGDDVDDMRVRHYVVDRISGPTEGQVQIVAKDLFAKIEAEKAVAPRASRGELAAGISAAAASATLSPTGIGNEDYPHMSGSPSEFYVAINDEIIKCSRSGDTLTLLQRGALGTEAAAHDEEDLVQWVLIYDRQLAHDIVYDLLTTYGGIDADAIDQAEWDTQAADLDQLYTGRIAAPVAVAELVGELCQQAGFTVWPDTSTGQVNLVALRSASSSAVVTDAAWVVERSLQLKRQDEKRVSQVWVYYGERNPLEDSEDPRNYRSRLVDVDLDAEDADQYGTAKIFEVFSRWIPQFGRSAAEDTSARILALFRDPPVEASFAIDPSRDGEITLARYFDLETAELQDVTGEASAQTHAVISLSREESLIKVRSQSVAFTGAQGEDLLNRTIFIENDADNIDLRAIHDSLYEAPAGGSPNLTVTFVVESGTRVGSTSTGSPAMRTGTWPAGTSLNLVNHGRIQGKGGDGGRGGGAGSANGSAGGAGGDALLVEYAISIDNTDGAIWGGAGAGGGGAAHEFNVFGFYTLAPGGGAGGGAGDNPGAGGASGTNIGWTDGAAGSSGTDSTGGSGGNGASGSPASSDAGSGGNGGAPGLSGSSGGSSATYSGGAGGAPGDYVQGNSLVTWVAIGDVRGSVS